MSEKMPQGEVGIAKVRSKPWRESGEEGWEGVAVDV